MHKLTSVEAQRVIAVMEDTLDKLNVLTYVPRTPRLDLLDALAASANPVKSCLQASIGDNLEQIYQSTRMLCRTLRRYPNAMETLLEFSKLAPRPQSGIVFNQYLSDLTGVMYRRLSTTVEEEAAKKHLLHDLTECEKLAEDERDALQQTLHATRTEKEREVSALDSTIKKRREELQEVTHTNAMEMESIKTKAADAMAKAKEDHEKKSRALTDRIERLAKETGEAAELHQQEETSARKKKAKAEVELAGTVAKYDRDMAVKTTQIDEIKAKMAEERVELAGLKDHFDRVDASGRQQWAEEETLAAVTGKVAMAMFVVDGAATTIQALFRGGRDRVEYQKAKKKAKKGGKGKGGKKGKKK